MQYIDYNAIIKNAHYFKQLLQKGKLCAVLKNNAYGHGIVRTAAALSEIADYFAVGSVEEALQVKEFCANILILLPIYSHAEIETALRHGFIFTVDSFATLAAIQNAVKDKKARVHIKIETGMNRLGFKLKNLSQLLKQLDNEKVSVEGVFSHFWGDSVLQCDVQLAEFLQACEFLCGYYPLLIRHIANTSATLLSDRYHLDMARIGLGLYGYGAPNLERAKTVTAKVIAKRNVSGGEIVGYGGKYIFPTDTTIAIIKCGYANGFPRALKNANVKFGQNFFPVVGNVCMAMLAVDVGACKIDIGDDVVLLGNGVNNANCDVIVYELLCNLR